MRSLVVAIASFLFTLPAWAAWVVVDDSGPIAYYIDTATVTKQGPLTQVWELQVARRRSDDGALSRKSLLEFNCKAQTFRVRAMSGYTRPMAEGAVLFNIEQVTEWSMVRPNTAGAEVMKRSCAL